MFSFLSDFLIKKGIDSFAPIPLDACRIIRPYLLERVGIASGTVILLVVPYFTPSCLDEKRNVSAYAVPRDYHGFFEDLYGELIPMLRERYPEHRFAAFADHSPIAEVEAAAMAGLGVIGENHLLLTPQYSSYIFLGEIVTDATFACNLSPIQHCEGCGACKKVCPFPNHDGCLSALTQKKGELSTDEQELILRYGSAWGCDLCQEVCPHTKKAFKNKTAFSKIPYFTEQVIPCLTTEILDRMTDDELKTRAYAWRGRNTVRRNLLLLEENPSTKGEETC